MAKEKDFKKNPKVSVIIPIYNAEKYLHQCLNSVIRQTLQNIEIICIDDGSTDSSAKILEQYAAKDKRFKIISKTNAGVGKARNDGIMSATGEFVAFIDPDDIYPDSKVLSNLYYKAIKNKVMICGGEFSLFTDDVKALWQDFNGTFQGYVFEKDSLIDYNDYQFDYGYHRFIYNREMLLQNKIFYPNYKRFQDPPFFVKAMITAQKFYALHKITYAYRVGHQNVVWTSEKICDLLSGLKDNFEFAAKYRLEHLNDLTYHRFEQHYEQIKNGLDKKSRKILCKLCRYNPNLANFCQQNNIFPTSRIKLPNLRLIAAQVAKNAKQFIIQKREKMEKKNKNQNIEKYSHTVKLFFFLPLYGWKQVGGRTTWNVLGLPIFKRRCTANGTVTKYYVLGLQILKKSCKIV